MIVTDTKAAEHPHSATVFFLYHEILLQPGEYSYAVSRDDFRQHIETFKSASINHKLFRPEVTFDDGSSSDVEIALPLLQAAEFNARFFITVGWTGTKSGYMDWAGIKELHRAGQKIGAHGWSHKMLSICPPNELRDELVRSKETLEQRLGIHITEMSLPGGRLTTAVLNAAEQAGYTRVFTSFPALSQANDITAGRVNVTANMRPSDLAALLQKDGTALRGMKRKHSFKLALRKALGDTLYFKLWALRNGYVRGDEDFE